MNIEGEGVLLSASDPMRFISCKHATALNPQSADRLPVDHPEPAGGEDKSPYLPKQKSDGLSVVEFGRNGELVAAAQATREAFAQDVVVLLHGTLFVTPYAGRSAFASQPQIVQNT
jgi:hypothetical protein